MRNRVAVAEGSLGAVAYLLLSLTGQTSLGFILFGGMAFLCWGEIFSLFPALCTDLFGPKYATTNTAVLYTAKGLAAFLVPLANIAVAMTGNWSSILYLTTTGNIVAVILVVTVLIPAEHRHHREDAIRSA